MATRMDPEDRRDDDVIVKPKDRGGNAWAWIIGILVIIALIVAALLLIPILTEEDEEGVVSQGEDLGVTTAEITDNPAEFIGEVVILSGEVDEVVAPNAFTMGADEGFFGGGEGLLVVSAEDVALPTGFVRGGEEEDGALLEDDIVQVRGVVAEFVIVEAEEELGVDLDDEAFADFEGETALLATEVVVTPRFAGDEVVGGEQGAQQIAPINVGDPEDITGNETFFNGLEVRLNDEIDEVITPFAFTFGEGDDALLVIGATPEDPLVEDDSVLVEGPVQTFVFAELEDNLAEFGIETEEDVAGFEEDLAEFEQRPVVFAQNLWTLTELNDIADDADGYAGLTPTVLGEVEQILSPNAFTVADGDVLIITPEPVEGIVDEASVLATGVVTRFDIVEIEEETGLTEDDLFAAEDEGAGGEGEEEDFNADDADGMATIIATEIAVLR